MYNGWGSIYWDSSVGDTAAWGLHLQSPPNVGVADQPLVDEFTTNYIVGGEALCLAPNFDNYTSAMGAISGITSPSNGSAVFNGTSDYIDIPSSDGISGITEDFTICFWGNLQSGKLNISKGLSDITEEFRVQIWDYKIYFDVGSGSGPYIYPSVTTEFNEWNHFGFTSKRTSGTTALNAYKNGSKITATTNGATNSHNTNSEPVFIGRFNNEYTNGNLANVAIWNRTLTSDEINSVMWKGYEEISTSERNGLQAWYSLDSVDTFADWYTYAQNQGAVIEGRTCVDNALNALAQL
jgi:hypothetical protein